jgi:hypothetical protein
MLYCIYSHVFKNETCVTFVSLCYIYTPENKGNKTEELDYSFCYEGFGKYIYIIMYIGIITGFIFGEKD